MHNFCRGCYGQGYTGILYWKKVCSVCKASTPKLYGDYMQPIPPRPNPPPPPPKKGVCCVCYCHR